MPQIGSAFLHQPIKGPRLAQLREGLAWLLEGARMLAPPPVRAFGWTPTQERIRFDGEGSATALGVVERSFLGAERLVRTGASRADLPAAVSLDKSLIFETSLDLPAEARATLKKTVALRMDEISPIPPAQALFAIGGIEKKSPGRLTAMVAIAKKKTIEAVEHALAGRPISKISVQTDKSSKRSYTFKKNRQFDARRTFRWISAAACVWIGVWFVAFAMEHRNERKLTALSEYEVLLLQEIRDLRADKEALAALNELAPPAATGDDFLRRTEELLARLPEKSVVESIAFDNDKIELSGLAPASAATKGVTPSIRRRPSDFPGYDRFETASALASLNGEVGR